MILLPMNGLSKPKEEEVRFFPSSFRPSDRDVICGWARQNHSHVGNQRFRKLIEKAVPLYEAAASKLEKSQVIATVVEQVRLDSPDGGFVKKNPTRGLWAEIGDDKARDKVGHAIRRCIDEAAKTKGKHSKVAGKLQAKASKKKPSKLKPAKEHPCTTSEDDDSASDYLVTTKTLLSSSLVQDNAQHERQNSVSAVTSLTEAQNPAMQEEMGASVISKKRSSFSFDPALFEPRKLVKDVDSRTRSIPAQSAQQDTLNDVMFHHHGRTLPSVHSNMMAPIDRATMPVMSSLPSQQQQQSQLADNSFFYDLGSLINQQSERTSSMPWNATDTFLPNQQQEALLYSHAVNGGLVGYKEQQPMLPQQQLLLPNTSFTGNLLDQAVASPAPQPQFHRQEQAGSFSAMQQMMMQQGRGARDPVDHQCSSSTFLNATKDLAGMPPLQQQLLLEQLQGNSSTALLRDDMPSNVIRRDSFW